jgi:hypothetical protein
VPPRFRCLGTDGCEGVGERTSGAPLRQQGRSDLFLTCVERLDLAPADCYVVGDAVWGLLAACRAGMLSVGPLSGGYGENELTRAGAFRVYRDTAELRTSLDELGVLSRRPPAGYVWDEALSKS